MTTFTDRIVGQSGFVAFKPPCRVATTGAITLAGLQTIDGITLAAGDRVLVKNQSTAADNGIWIAAAGAWTRAADFDGARDVENGTQVFVANGTTNGGRNFSLTTANPVTIGTSGINFTTRALSAPEIPDIRDWNGDVQAAINGAAPEGQLFIPKGTWDFSTVSVTAPLRIFGAHPTESVLRTTHATANAITVFGVPNAPGVIFENLGFKHAVTRSAGATIFNNGSQGTWIRHCRFDGPYNGVVDGGLPSVGFKVTDTEMHGVVNDGVFFNASSGAQGSVYAKITGFTCDAASGANGNAAIRVRCIGDVTIDRCESLFMKYGILADPQNGKTVQLVKVDNCVFDTGDTNGIRVSPASGGIVQTFKVANTWCATFDDGIVLDGAGEIRGAYFTGCTVGNNRNNGLWVNSAAVDHLYVAGGDYGQNVQSGIAISDDLLHLSIIGAQIGTGGQWSLGNNRGIFFADGVTWTTLNIESNKIIDSTTAVVRWPGDVVPSQSNVLRVENNAGYATGNRGVVASATTDGSGDITVAHGLSVTPTRIFVSREAIAAPFIMHVHTVGSSTFKIRIWDAAGSAVTSTSVSGIMWQAGI